MVNNCYYLGMETYQYWLVGIRILLACILVPSCWVNCNSNSIREWSIIVRWFNSVKSPHQLQHCEHHSDCLFMHSKVFVLIILSLHHHSQNYVYIYIVCPLWLLWLWLSTGKGTACIPDQKHTVYLCTYIKINLKYTYVLIQK